jgi:hypothetical protein
MARSRQRSIRIEDRFSPLIDSLPEGTVNTFFNELLRLFSEEPALQQQVRLTDERFNDWKMPELPTEMVDKMVKPEAKAPRKSALPVDKKPVEVAQQGPIEEVEQELVPSIETKKAKEQAEIAAAVASEPEPVDGAAAFDEAVGTEPAPVEKPVQTVEKEPEPVKSTLDALFPGM